MLNINRLNISTRLTVNNKEVQNLSFKSENEDRFVADLREDYKRACEGRVTREDIFQNKKPELVHAAVNYALSKAPNYGVQPAIIKDIVLRGNSRYDQTPEMELLRKVNLALLSQNNYSGNF